jgi:hypothetical protein
MSPEMAHVVSCTREICDVFPSAHRSYEAKGRARQDAKGGDRRERIATAVLAGFAANVEAANVRLVALRRQAEAINATFDPLPAMDAVREATATNAVRWADALIAELDK